MNNKTEAIWAAIKGIIVAAYREYPRETIIILSALGFIFLAYTAMLIYLIFIL